MSCQQIIFNVIKQAMKLDKDTRHHWSVLSSTGTRHLTWNLKNWAKTYFNALFLVASEWFEASLSITTPAGEWHFGTLTQSQHGVDCQGLEQVHAHSNKHFCVCLFFCGRYNLDGGRASTSGRVHTRTTSV